MTFVNSRINVAGQQMLHDYLLPFITLTKNDKTIFQQNNVSIQYFLQKSDFKISGSSYYGKH